MHCQICASPRGSEFAAREMMFGTRESFRYFACDDCRCIQLVDPPADLSRHYPADYYSLAAPIQRTGLRRRFRDRRNRGTFAPAGTTDRLLARAFPYPVAGARDWMPRAGVSRTSRVLDVGSGQGVLLLDLATAGFTDLLGIDPYIADTIVHPLGVRIERRTIHDVDGPFDLVMFHHSFEHLADPLETLRSVARILASNGCCLIRIPTASSWAWEHYREHWVQLDPPRHFFLHSRESLARLAEQAGLVVTDVVYDSTEFQFTGSELYRRDRPLTELATAYSSAELRAFRRRADALNAEHRGDQAAFYLRRR
jgi:SAM-dependent methyltransferase